MQNYKEGNLDFQFPDHWLICRPEVTSFYKNHFQSLCGGCKETDFLGFDPNTNILWMIEVKDFRVAGSGERDIPLEQEIAEKARDTLACILPAACRDNSTAMRNYRDFAKAARTAGDIRVVFHLEQPKLRSKLFPGVKIAADFEQQLKRKLRPVDPHAKVTYKADTRSFPWTVL